MNNDYVQDYLMHHGIKGMKWGQRKAVEGINQRLNEINNISNEYKRLIKQDKNAPISQAYRDEIKKLTLEKIQYIDLKKAYENGTMQYGKDYTTRLLFNKKGKVKLTESGIKKEKFISGVALANRKIKKSK